MRLSKHHKTRAALAVGVLLVAAGLVTGCSLIVAKEREPGVCGDGRKDPNEECDGNDFGNQTCKDINGEGSTGVLHCDNACHIDSSDCTPVDFCGDNICGPSEDAISCPQDCSVYAVCGDGVINGDEDCDEGDLDGATCALLGFDGGTLACLGNCTLDMSGCGPLESCGNGAVDHSLEFCDTQDLNGQNCISLGFQSGPNGLGCSADCQFDISGCDPPNLWLPDGSHCTGPGVCKGDTCIKGDFGGIVINGYCSHECIFNVCPGGGVCIVDGPGGQGPLCYERCENPQTCLQNGFACDSPFVGFPMICWPDQ